jgi:alpha-galactosidase
MREKIVLIGAGSRGFTGSLLADMTRMGMDADVVLVDIDPDALEVARRVAHKLLAARPAPLNISATTDRRAALSGATVVITTISVGGRRAWERDVFIPRRYGIYAPVGDSVGVGGLSRALRMIPPMVEIAQDVLDLAPDALFFNYSNPMSAICRAVIKATGASVVGLCHGVKGDGIRYLSRVLDVPAHMLRFNAVGINHLTWFTEMRLHGSDIMPRLRDIARTHLEHGLTRLDGINPRDYLFSWQLFERFGVFPCVLDRHVTEFFPQFFRDGHYYGKRLGVDAFSFENTIASGDREYALMHEVAYNDAPLPAAYLAELDADEEEVLDMIASIRADRGETFYANLPNTGFVPNLPLDAIVELPAIANVSGLHALAQPPLSSGIVGTLMPHIMAVEVVVEAALKGSRDAFIQALVIDGSVNAVDSAVRLADELLEAHADDLPAFSKAHH